jgi:hypothetical protein
MKKTLIFVAAFLLATTTLKSQNVGWAKSVGGTGADDASSICEDALGNVYTTGVFSGTADFDPGAGIANCTSLGLTDIFVLKLNAAGNFLWVKSFGGTLSDAGVSINIDASGNVYTTGYFQGNTDFDPGAGNVSLTSAGDWDIFIHKMDASGNFLWVITFGGIESDIGYSVNVDASGNVYTTGDFIGTVDFDPGAGITNLTSAAGRDNFVLKLNASGNFIWAKSFGTSSTGSNDVTNSLCLDASGNIYTTGCFKGTGDFDPGIGTAILTSTGDYEIFVQKMDASGNFLWVKSFGGTTGNDRETFSSVDALGNVYTTGRFEGTGDFDPAAGIMTLTSTGLSNIFVQKMDALGNFLWANSFGGVNFDGATSIMTDPMGGVFTTGYYGGTVDFDSGAGTAMLTSAGDYDVFVQKMDASGNFLWAKSFGGTARDRANCISLDASGNIYTAGHFQGTGDFGLIAGTSILTSAGADDIFIQKISSSSLPTELMYFDVRRNNREIALTWATASEINNKFFAIERSLNSIDWELVKKIVGAGHSDNVREYHTIDNNPFPGTSYYRLKQIDMDEKYTYSVIKAVTFEATVSNVSVYPNPITGKLWIAFEKETTNVEVMLSDMHGKVIYKKTYASLYNTTLQLNVAKGIYLLTIKTPQGPITKKIVKE